MRRACAIRDSEPLDVLGGQSVYRIFKKICRCVVSSSYDPIGEGIEASVIKPSAKAVASVCSCRLGAPLVHKSAEIPQHFDCHQATERVLSACPLRSPTCPLPTIRGVGCAVVALFNGTGAMCDLK